MIRYALLAFALLAPLTVRAQESDAKKLAQEILDKGSALYDTRDAAAMTATYTDDAKIHWYSKNNAGTIESSVKSGHAEIEGVYLDMFKNKDEKTISRNTVEFARLISSDVLVIQGVFEPNVAAPGKYPFVQVRLKVGDKWLMKSLEFFVLSQN